MSSPTTLHELAGALLESMGAECLVQLGRVLDDNQITFLRAITRAEDDDTSAEAIAMLMQSLMVNPAAVLALQQALSPDQIAALQQLAKLAQRHLEERTAERNEGAPPSSGDAPSPGKDGAGS